MEMYRARLLDMKEWKNKSSRKPLFIRGARQVGKTWLMETFGREDFGGDVAELDFEQDKSAHVIFDGDIDIERIIQDLKMQTGRDIVAGKTLIILDEIQKCPRALTSLKYFCDKAPEYHVVVGGSLLGVLIRESDESFPVGKVDRLNISPMTFNEFLIAMGENGLAQFIDEIPFNNLSILPGYIERLAAVKSRLVAYLKDYIYIGGMPEVVKDYVENGKSYQRARARQLAILDDYQGDFGKHAPSDETLRITEVWDSIPAQLSKENKKFVYGQIKESARGREYNKALLWLEDAALTRRIKNTTIPHSPLKSYLEDFAFKIYCLDVGLLGAMANLQTESLIEDEGVFKEFKGALAEQYVLQELANLSEENASSRATISYWSQGEGNSAHEVDFLMEIRGAIIPIEVKSGTNIRAKSLKAYIEKYNPEYAIIASLNDYCESEISGVKVYNVPLYAIRAFLRAKMGY